MLSTTRRPASSRIRRTRSPWSPGVLTNSLPTTAPRMPSASSWRWARRPARLQKPSAGHGREGWYLQGSTLQAAVHVPLLRGACPGRQGPCSFGPQERGFRLVPADARGRAHLTQRGRCLQDRCRGNCGLGGMGFAPRRCEAVCDNRKDEGPKSHFAVGIKDDVTNSSLRLGPAVNCISETAIQYR